MIREGNDFEEIRKNMLSAMYLAAQDKAEQQNEISSKESSDFWRKLDSIIQRHEAQMDKVTNLAGDIRSEVTSSRFNQNKAHNERMIKAKEMLEQLEAEIKKMTEQNTKSRIEQIQQKVQTLNAENQSLQNNIAELENSVSDLRNQTNEAQRKKDSFSIAIQERELKLNGRWKLAQNKAITLDGDINELQQGLSIAEAEIQEHEERLNAIKSIAEVISTPHSTVKKICNYED